MSPLRIAAVASFAVGLLMFVLATIGTYDEGLYVTWLAVGVIGVAGGAGLAKLDDAQRRQRLDEERRRRLGGASGS